jgi:tetratricopeptide (TPR) repeat protein
MRVDARNEPRVAPRATRVTRSHHQDDENPVERPRQPSPSHGLRKHLSVDHSLAGFYLQPMNREHNKPTDIQRSKPTDSQHNKPTDSEHIEDVCASCKDREKELDKSREATKVLEHKCRALEHKCWALEIDQFKTLKPDDNLQYVEAENLYEKLESKWKELGEEADQKGKLISLKIAFVDMQIERKEYLRAEKIARNAREECKDEDTNDGRLIYRQLCKILRQRESEKHPKLEALLRETWPTGEKHQSDFPWTLENGDELCSVLELQGAFEAAYVMRKRLWEERGGKQGKGHKDTVQTGIWASQCSIKGSAAFEKSFGDLGRRVAYEQAMKIVKEIWELWDPKIPSEADVGILTAGHLLGYLHYCQRAYTDARRILEVVWKERKIRFIQSPEDTMLTGHYLSQTYFQLRDYPRAESVFEEIWDAMKFARGETSQNRVLNAYHLSIDCLENPSTTGSKKKPVPERGGSHLPSETLEVLFEIGRAVLNQGKYQNAACILQEVYDAYRAAPENEPHYEDTLICGRYLAEAIAKQGGRCLEATTILKEVLEEQAQRGRKDEFEVLECRYLYARLLKELAESQSTSQKESFQKAEEALVSLWQTRNKTKPPGLERHRMLETGHCLVSALSSLRKFSEAHRVLGEVCEFEGKGTGEKSCESLTFCHSLGISLMDLGKDKLATELFQRVWDTRKRPLLWTGVLEDGYYLGLCRMKQQQYPQAKEVLEDVEKMIEEAQIGDQKSLTKAVRESLDNCKTKTKARKGRRGN